MKADGHDVTGEGLLCLKLPIFRLSRELISLNFVGRKLATVRIWTEGDKPEAVDLATRKLTASDTSSCCWRLPAALR
jgi:hypothetical protein